MNNRAHSAEDGFSSAQQDELSGFLEEHAPHLHAELQMLQALVTDARWKRAASFAAPAAASAGADRGGCGCEGDNDAAAAAAVAAASTSCAAPPIAVVVPLNTTEADGASVLSRARLHILIEQPAAFPDYEESCISVALKSSDLAGATRSDIASAVCSYARELADSGALSLASLAARAEELLLGVPIEQQAKAFCCCLACNRARVAKGLEKQPQPCRVDPVLQPDAVDIEREQQAAIAAAAAGGRKAKAAAAAAAVAATAAASASASAAPRFKASCLVCRSELVVLVPSLSATSRECSFCMCDDFPMLRLSCERCWSCFDCFCRFAELATASGEVCRGVAGWRAVGIRCPNHRTDSVINDPGLLKLLPLRTLMRFHTFAMRDFAAKLVPPGIPSSSSVIDKASANCLSCNNPACNVGAPQICNLFAAGLGICFFCNRATCFQCGNYALKCECTALRPQQRRILSLALEQMFEREAIPMEPDAVVVCHEFADLMFLCGAESIVVRNVPLHRPGEWANFVEFHVWQNVVVNENKRKHATWVAVHQGVPMRRDRALARYGVYSTAVVFVVPVFELNPREDALAEEIELWQFRRSAAASAAGGAGGDSKTSAAVIAETAKKCPTCSAFVSHWRGHACHHMTCRCGAQWCYVCGLPWPCPKTPKCPLFCTVDGDGRKDCGCVPCTECRPSFPCPTCPGCPRCRATEKVFDGFS